MHADACGKEKIMANKAPENTGWANLNGMADDDDKTCALNDMNCVGEDDDSTCGINDMNCVGEDDDATCSINNMNCEE